VTVGVGVGLALDSGSTSPEETIAQPAPIYEAITPPVVQPAIVYSSNFQPELPTGFELPVTPPPPAAPEPVLPAAAPPVPQAAAPASKPIAAPAPPPPPAVAAKPNFYLPDVPGGPITGLEQRLLDGINAQRTAAGLAPYALDPSLSKIARIRSQQMADQGYFGHVDPYGYSMYVELIQRFGIGYGWAGENLAMNNYGVGESPERAVVSLMKSPSHAANILAGDFKRVGVGEVTTADGRHIYTMIFVG
jgi:uncharacterized protein YkwD